MIDIVVVAFGLAEDRCHLFQIGDGGYLFALPDTGVTDLDFLTACDLMEEALPARHQHDRMKDTIIYGKVLRFSDGFELDLADLVGDEGTCTMKLLLQA